MLHVMVSRLARTFAVVSALLLAAPAAQASTLFTQVGRGWGHGIGMSQWGAYGYAQHGWGYPAILDHYYANVVLGSLSGPTPVRVLMTSGAASLRFQSDSDVRAVDEGAGASHPLPAGAYRVEPGTTAGVQRVWSVAQGA